jgi:hypothetical protein
MQAHSYSMIEFPTLSRVESSVLLPAPILEDTHDLNYLVRKY